MNRIKVVRQALDGRVKRVYLEIGVKRGVAFRSIFTIEAVMPRSSSAMMKAAPISPSAWANPSADEGERGDGEERLDGLHYLRHSAPLPSMSTISADTPCFSR